MAASLQIVAALLATAIVTGVASLPSCVHRDVGCVNDPGNNPSSSKQFELYLIQTQATPPLIQTMAV
jgi:hypothetical protein